MLRTLSNAWLLTCIFIIASSVYVAAGNIEDLRSFSDEQSRRQLISYLISNRQLAYTESHKNDPNTVLINKIRSQPELCKHVADAIFVELHCVKIRHDNSHLPFLLGKLSMPDHLTALILTTEYFDCCYGPSLVQGLAACAPVDYAPVLIQSFEKESDGSSGCVQAGLIKMTGYPPNQNKSREDWVAWWKKTYPEKTLDPPSDKYHHLLSDARIVLIENLRTVMRAIHKHGENPINRYQLGPPTYPNSLDELIGFEYTSGKKITQEHIDSVKYRKPPKEQARLIPYDFHFLADDSLEESHGFIAVLHGEGRINLVKPDDSAQKVDTVRLFWPNKWKKKTSIVTYNR